MHVRRARVSEPLVVRPHGDRHDSQQLGFGHETRHRGVPSRVGGPRCASARAVRHRGGARECARQLGRRDARRHRHVAQHGDRHHRVHPYRRERQLPVPQRPHRALRSVRGAAGLLQGHDHRRRRGGERAAARRSHDAGRDGLGRSRRDLGRPGAGDRFERTRPGHRARADREPAAQRAFLLQPRPAVDRRARVEPERRRHERPRGFVQHQRAAQYRQQFPARRHRQQRLRHQQPGLLEPGDPGVARRRGRVQGPDQQLQRRVRPQRRRGHQRLLPERHQRTAGQCLGVQPQHRPQRDRLLQADGRRQADAVAQPVRVRPRRADPQGSRLLLRRLRRLPPDPTDARVLHDSDAAPTRGHPHRPGDQPVHRRSNTPPARRYR